MDKKEIKLFTEERKMLIQFENQNMEYYVIFSFEENGDVYYLLTDREKLIIAKSQDNKLVEITDEKEIEIISEIVDEFANEHLVLDENGNDFLARFYEYGEIN
ncbi:Uncharacterised protein [Metamycoplasma cloacale]|uniref:DUF1292 domain-containing protein n=1 Tax=Metamycoplasma cloacale TaxID=92401 RepID=A0A2Z4LLX9_9BACT|nr:DUF1292 domain-containing protein [Metamycoplasma cloacale]AWX42745.1 DUF1292 domain-containing protein [Metamycoplasma cloacale]VEU79440.1 Uncharacterised protein [Metamycoplasma cloacale]